MARIQGMTMTRGSRMLLFLAIAAGLVAAVLVFVALSQNDDGTVTVSPGEGSAKVVVAAQNIPAGTEITQDMVKTLEVPEALLVAGAYTESATLVGQTARIPILSGEQIPASKIGAADDGEGLSFVVPKGKRAVSVSINEVTAVGGLLRPGDRVDVFVSYVEDSADGQSFGRVLVYTILQDIEVLSVAQEAQTPLPAPATDQAPEGQQGLSTSGQLPEDVKEQPNAGTVTVAVDPAQARLLVCTQDGADNVWLALRAFGEAAPVEGSAVPPACQ